MEIYKFSDYKLFIRHQIKGEKQPRGYRSKLAAAAQCQKSYISQVLNSGAHLSCEQAIGLSLFWKLSELETEYLLELVNLEKASFGPLRARIERRLKGIKNIAEDAQMQGQKRVFSQESDRALYYSSWYYCAIHILTSIPGFQAVEAIASRLELSKSVVQEVLKDLSRMKLVTSHGSGKWVNIPGGLHNPPGTLISGIHHQNWRQRAMLSYFQSKEEHLHYTDVHSVSRLDYKMLRDFFFDKINEFRSVVKPSSEEEMACLCIDYFKG